MKISTTYFGQQEIDPESIITFPNGLLGFESLTRFTLFHEEDKPTVHWLQSVDDPNITLSVSEPALFGISYEFVVNDDDAALIGLDKPEDALVLLVLSKGEDDDVLEHQETGAKVRGNLNGPIVINQNNRKGIQKVIVRSEKTTLIRELNDA